MKPERKSAGAPSGAVGTDVGTRRRPLRWFIAMPARMAFDTGLSPMAFRLASLLLHYEGDRGCFPSQSRLSKDLGVSEDSTARYLRELELYGFLARQKRNGVHNTYILAPLYEPPIAHGSIEETGSLEVENAPKRRPPRTRDLRVKRPDPELPLKSLAPVKPISSARSRRGASADRAPSINERPAALEPPAPARVVAEAAQTAAPASERVVANAHFLDEARKVPAPVRVVNDVSHSEPAAPVRVEPTATVRVEPAALARVDHPHARGSKKNEEPNEHKNHHQELARPIVPGGEEEKITGLGALQRSGVNVGRRDLGVHEGRGRILSDDELLAWARWVAGPAKSGIANKAAFAAAKVRMGCVLEEAVPAAGAARRNEEITAAAQRETDARDRADRERMQRADVLLAALTPAERAVLRDQALNDASVWLARKTSGALFSVIVAAAERRLALGETEPCPTARDHSSYPELPPT